MALAACVALGGKTFGSGEESEEAKRGGRGGEAERIRSRVVVDDDGKFRLAVAEATQTARVG